MKYEILTKTVDEHTIDEIINTLSFINETLDALLENPDPEAAAHPIHCRPQFVTRRVAVHLWLFRQRHIDHGTLVPIAKETIMKLRDVKRMLDRLGLGVTPPTGLTTNSELNDDADHVPWFTNEWWTDLFSDFACASDNSSTHEQHTDGEFRIDTPSPHLPIDTRHPPPWPEPQMSSSFTVARLPPPVVLSPISSGQLRTRFTTDDIV